MNELTSSEGQRTFDKKYASKPLCIYSVYIGVLNINFSTAKVFQALIVLYCIFIDCT